MIDQFQFKRSAVVVERHCYGVCSGVIVLDHVGKDLFDRQPRRKRLIRADTYILETAVEEGKHTIWSDFTNCFFRLLEDRLSPASRIDRWSNVITGAARRNRNVGPQTARPAGKGFPRYGVTVQEILDREGPLYYYGGVLLARFRIAGSSLYHVA